MNKKVAIPMIAGSCALITVGSGTLIAYQLIDNNKSNKLNTSETKPLNRGDDYIHYKLNEKLEEDNFVTQILDKKLDGDEWVKSINETKFRDYMENNIRKVLKNTKDFGDEIDQYEIVVNYVIQDGGKVAFDIVWTPPNELIHYYDPLLISF